MAQRELKVKVTANIDKSLTKLLDSLKKTKNLKVKVDVKKGDLTSVTKTLDRLSKKTISPKVSVKTNDKGLSNLQKDLNRLGSQKVTASVNVKTNSSGLDGLQKDMDSISRKADEVGSARISPIGVASGLAPLAVTLDQLSDKILQISQQTIAPIFTEALDASKELYDQQTSFMKQFQADGRSDADIKSWMKQLSSYAQSSIFDTDQLMGLFGTFEGSGMDDPMGITKALAGITSMAPNVNTALDRVGRQFKQFTKDGNVYTRDWNAIRDAIGGVAANKLNDWFKKNKGIELIPDSFAKGAVSVKDFIQATKEVGVSDMFQKLAQNTDTLSGSLAQFKETLRNTLIGDQYDPGPLRSLFDGFVKGLNQVTDQIPVFAKDLGKALEFLKKEFGNAFKDFSVKDFFNGLKSSFQSAVPVIKVVAKALALLTNNGKDTGKVIGNLVKFAVGWKMFRGLAQPVLSLASAGGTLYKVASKLGGLKFGSGGILGKMFGGGSSGGGSKSSKVPSIKNIKAQALNTAKNLATLAGVLATVWASAKAMESISNMDISWNGLLNNLSATAVGLTLAGGYMATIGVAMDKIKSLKKALAQGAIAVTGVSASLWAVAQLVTSVSNLKINGGNLAKNLGILALTLTASGVYMLAIGEALKAFPEAGGAIALGAVALIGIAGALIAITAEMDVVVKNLVRTANRMNDIDVSAMGIIKGVGKLTELSLALGAMSAITIAPNVISAIGGFFGGLANMAQNWNIDEAMKLIEKISSIKVPQGGFKKTMKNVTELMTEISDFNAGTILPNLKNGLSGVTSFFSGLGNMAQGFNLDTSLDIIEKINNFKIPDAKTFKDKISKVKEIMAEISNVSTADSGLEALGNAGKEIFSAFASWAQGLDISQISDAFSKVTDLTTTLNGLNLDDSVVKDVKGKISKIKGVMSALKEAMGQSDSDSNLEKLQDAGGNAIDAGSSWLQGFNIDNIIKQIQSVTSAIDKIKNIQIDDSVVSEISTKLASIKAVMNKLREFAGQNTDGSALGGLANFGQGLIDGLANGAGGLANMAGAFNVDQIMSVVQSVKRAVDKLNSIDISEQTVSDVSTKLNNVKSVMKKLQEFSSGFGGGSASSDFSGAMAGGIFGKFVSNLVGAGENATQNVNLDQIVTMIGKIKKIIVTLQSIPDIDSGGIATKIDNVKSAMQKIAEIQITVNPTGDEDGVVSFDKILGNVNKITEIVNAINAIPVVAEGLAEKVTQIKTAINQLLSIGSGLGGDDKGGEVAQGASALNSLLQQVNSILSQLQALSGQFQSTGTSYAQSLVNGFNGGGVDRIVSKMQSVVSRLNGMANLSHIGARMSSTLASGFNASGLINRINSIQAAINSLKGKTVTININEVTTKSTVRRANGGIIPEYHSTGGRVGSRLFKKRGTDTVPAMLTPGEYVLKRSVSNALGKGFLDALNGLNLSSAMAQLQNKVGGNVTNNTYNNITQNVDNKASYLNGLGSIRRVVRS